MTFARTMYMVLILIAVTNTQHTQSFSIKKVQYIFSARPYEEETHHRYTLPENGTLQLENKNGNITIKTTWKQNDVFVSAKKKATTEELLKTISIKSQMLNDTTLQISSTCNKKTDNEAVDYTLIIPAHTSLQLQTKTGSIIVKKAPGNLTATTTTGSIEIHQALKPVQATVLQNGSITIHHAHDTVQATTNRGNISIDNANKSIHATTDTGNITVTSKEINSTDSLKLRVKNSGNIVLHSPKNTNATVSAKTAKGTVLSDQYITIKPFATKLNRKAWLRFKREIDGVLGSGEASIALNTNCGNIKLLCNKK